MECGLLVVGGAQLKVDRRIVTGDVAGEADVVDASLGGSESGFGFSAGDEVVSAESSVIST